MHSLRRHRAILVLLLAALLLRGLLPLGYMPGRVDGGLGMVVCPGMGSGDAHALHHGHGGEHKACPFGFAAAMGAPLLAHAAPELPRARVDRAVPRAVTALARSVRPPLPARGPPTLV